MIETIYAADLFGKADGLMDNIRGLLILVLSVVALGLLVMAAIKGRGSLGLLIGAACSGLLALFFATNMEGMSGDVEDTWNQLSPSVVVAEKST